MKIPELYIGDILVVLEAIDFAAYSITEGYLKKAKTYKRKSFFMPWAKQELAKDILSSAEFALGRISHLKSIREKLLQSTGTDEDMRPVTLEELLKKNAARAN